MYKNIYVNGHKINRVFIDGALVFQQEKKVFFIQNPKTQDVITKLSFNPNETNGAFFLHRPNRDFITVDSNKYNRINLELVYEWHNSTISLAIDDIADYEEYTDYLYPDGFKFTKYGDEYVFDFEPYEHVKGFNVLADIKDEYVINNIDLSHASTVTTKKQAKLRW